MSLEFSSSLKKLSSLCLEVFFFLSSFLFSLWVTNYIYISYMVLFSGSLRLFVFFFNFCLFSLLHFSLDNFYPTAFKFSSLIFRSVYSAVKPTQLVFHSLCCIFQFKRFFFVVFISVLRFFICLLCLCFPLNTFTYTFIIAVLKYLSLNTIIFVLSGPVSFDCFSS